MQCIDTTLGGVQLSVTCVIYVSLLGGSGSLHQRTLIHPNLLLLICQIASIPYVHGILTRNIIVIMSTFEYYTGWALVRIVLSVNGEP